MKRIKKHKSKRSRKTILWVLVFFVLIGIEVLIAGILPSAPNPVRGCCGGGATKANCNPTK